MFLATEDDRGYSCRSYLCSVNLYKVRLRETMFPFITLTDGIVTLRPFEFGEEKGLLKAVHESIPELEPWMSWANENYTNETALNFITLTRAYWSNGIDVCICHHRRKNRCDRWRL